MVTLKVWGIAEGNCGVQEVKFVIEGQNETWFRIVVGSYCNHEPRKAEDREITFPT